MTALSASSVEDRLVAQPPDARSLSSQDRDLLIISTIQVDGVWVIKSHYGDDVWHLTGHATNKPKSKKTIDFSRTPTPYRSLVKEFIYRYLRRGLDGHALPSATTLTIVFNDLQPFIRHLDSQQIRSLSEVTPLVCSTYVADTKAERVRGDVGKPLSKSQMMGRFKAVEMLYKLSQHSATPIPLHPWPESSATRLAGRLGRDRRSKTPLIPDDVFTRLFQKAHTFVQQGDALLDLRDALVAVAASRKDKCQQAIGNAKNDYLKKKDWEGGLRAFNAALLNLRDACYIVVACLSGCRNHELAYVQTGACHRTADDEGELYWWMASQSDKTGVGKTEWMIPIAAVEALRVMDRWATPYQTMISEEISLLRENNPLDPEIAEAQRHAAAVFLGVSPAQNNRVRTLSDARWNTNLKAFSKRIGLDWNLTTLQFRRKFANYAARSLFGDLRYLRDHFKHWSQDMTNDSYALNESQEMELYAEIQEELDGIKLGLAEQWLSAGEPLAGGYGKNLMDWRSREENIILFKDHATMVKSVAESHAIRSNGHAWCTADDKKCIGNSFEKTRCSGCNNAVIGRAHARLYQNLYSDLKTLSGCDDIGTGGQARVLRDLERCRDVLVSLGYDPEATTGP